MSQRLRSALFAVVVALLGLLARPASAAPRPRLGVLVIFDQFPAWELERYAPFFGDGGFGGLDGAHYDAWYAYAGTETGPGHATLATGALPAMHGIATNSWFHEGKKVYAVDDPTAPVLAPTPTDPAAKAPWGRSARQLLVPTLGDAMRAESDGRAKVVTVSHKDRSAILTAGRSANLAIWYDPQQGRYTTSTAYAPSLPAWLSTLGAELPQQAMTSGTWSPLPVPSGLEALVPVDDREGEAALAGFGRTFPHDLKSVEPALQKSGYRLVPQSIADLFTIALRAVDEVGLGADDEPDLLVVSVSTTDVVGHNYGGGSLEQLDTLRRADLELRRFLRGLAQRVGKNRFVVAVSSDHGAPDLPQSLAKLGFGDTAITYDEVIDAAQRAAAAAAPKEDKKKRVQGFSPPQLFVDVDDLDAAAAGRVLAAVGAAVEAIPGIARVYDLADSRDVDSFVPFMRASAPPGRAARLFVRHHPRVVMLEEKGQSAGTDHGTPYAYDRRVPFLLAGPGVRRGRSAERVDTRDVSATLAFLLGVPPPDACQGHPVGAVGQLR